MQLLTGGYPEVQGMASKEAAKVDVGSILISAAVTVRRSRTPLPRLCEILRIFCISFTVRLLHLECYETSPDHIW